MKRSNYSDTCISEIRFFRKSDFDLEMEVYKLNTKRTLSDNEIELMLNYLGKINWKKYKETIDMLIQYESNIP